MEKSNLEFLSREKDPRPEIGTPKEFNKADASVVRKKKKIKKHCQTAVLSTRKTGGAPVRAALTNLKGELWKTCPRI